MRAIFGIGNPGSSYQHNRHNAGFLFLNHLAEKLKINFQASKYDYYYASSQLRGFDFILIKPTTYVNNCGVAAKQVIDEKKLVFEEFIVVCDDINLNNGNYRLRLGGSDGGHNGLKSIIYNIGSEMFPRIRLGVNSNPGNTSLSEYVLDNFTKDEFETFSSVFDNVSILTSEFITGGIKKMLDMNSKLKNLPLQG